MQKFLVSELLPHPQNSFFFDDMTGEKWEEFLESVRTSGIIEPPVVTGDRVIVSGHQRIRACKELGITEISCEVRIYDSEDKVLKDLIETNIRQRGNINSSELKMGRIIDALKRIYGISKGANLPNAHCERPAKTADQVADELGMSRQAMNRYEKLLDMIPEFQEALETGKINAKTGYSVIARLSEEEQMQLLRNLPATLKLTQAQVQTEVDKIRSEYESKLADAEDRLVEAQAHYSEEDLSIPGEPTKEENYDEDYVRLSRDLENAKDYANSQFDLKEKFKKERDNLAEQLKTSQAKLKSKEQETIDLERRLNRAVQGDGAGNVSQDDERIQKLESELRRTKEELKQYKFIDANKAEIPGIQKTTGVNDLLKLLEDFHFKIGVYQYVDMIAPNELLEQGKDFIEGILSSLMIIKNKMGEKVA